MNPRNRPNNYRGLHVLSPAARRDLFLNLQHLLERAEWVHKGRLIRSERLVDNIEWRAARRKLEMVRCVMLYHGETPPDEGMEVDFYALYLPLDPERGGPVFNGVSSPNAEPR